MRYRRRKKSDIAMLWDRAPDADNYAGRKRAIVLKTIVFFCFSVVFFKLFYLMVIQHKGLSEKAEQQYSRAVTLMPQRGTIYDRSMRELAVNIETNSLYAVPVKMENVNDVSSRLSPVVKVSANILSSRLADGKGRKSSFMWIARKMDEDMSRGAEKVKDKLKNTVGVVTETKRYYPKGQLAAHILGYTDIDNKGLEGIERRYDKHMKGQVKKVQLGRDAHGLNLANNTEEGIPGNSLLLTIDEGLQHIVERELAGAVETWHAEGAVGIMMDPLTGEIFALANMPTYDLNVPADADVSERRNRAITDSYEPGSTFKVISASGVIEEGLVTPESKFDCSKGYINVGGGKPIRDVHKNGVLTFKECVQKSSNVCLIQAGTILGEKKFYEYVKGFGFGDKTGIDLIGEVGGLLKSPGAWSGRTLATMSIGQEIGVTPLQILRAYSAIANGGRLMKPYIVSEVISPDRRIIEKSSPKVERQVVSEETAKTMRDILKTVVTEGGTAQRASIKGNAVAGKTGTAQMIDPKTGRYSSSDYVSSFVGFVPADNPRISLIIVVFKPRGASYGGTVAAPVFRNIIEQTLTYLDVPMERDENNITLVSR
ncbi:MAG: penicillin-binding protein [Nitrospirae bacterium]|nr:penicillin-binding protein [Nitrospirota bacterium]